MMGHQVLRFLGALRFWALFACLTPGLSHASAGEFELLEGSRLWELARGESASTRGSITARELDALPQALSDSRVPFLLVKTGQGNLSRLLVSSGFKKPETAGGAAVPVLVIEQFSTFEPGKSGSRLARGAGTLLFDGFQLDLDTGQVVPEGQGGDLAFHARPGADSTLKALDRASILILKGPVAAPVSSQGPTPGRTIVPSDFAGRYQLSADGRYAGTLELEVAPDRAITGHFRSEPNGTTYELTGEVLAGTTNKARFSIKFPRTVQEFDAYLGGEGKQSIAGTYVMLDRVFGFFALRMGVSDWRGVVGPAPDSIGK